MDLSRNPEASYGPKAICQENLCYLDQISREEIERLSAGKSVWETYLDEDTQSKLNQIEEWHREQVGEEVANKLKLGLRLETVPPEEMWDDLAVLQRLFDFERRELYVSRFNPDESDL